MVMNPGNMTLSSHLTEDKTRQAVEYSLHLHSRHQFAPQTRYGVEYVEMHRRGTNEL